MNFLAHLYLSPPEDEALLGSVMGDFVKGPLDTSAPTPLQRGLVLHRKIDAYTDAHAVVSASRARIGQAHRRYAGIMLDMFYDHCLARDWRHYSDQPLAGFTQRIYALLLANLDRLPERLRRIAPRMAAQDWLSSYGRIDAIHLALDRMGERLRRGNALRNAGKELSAHYEALHDDFRRFFPDLVDFARRTAEALPRA